MSKLQKILLISGSVILIILSSILVMMYRAAPDEEQLLNQANNIQNASTTSEENMNTLNITSNGENQEATGVNEIEDEELQQYIREALENVTLNTSYTEPTEQSFFEHALLYQYVTNLTGDRLSLEEMEEEASWIAKELYAWVVVANEKADFQYEEEAFLSFIEEENFVNEDDLQTIAILNALKERDESLYVRHLEYHYMKPYIWSQIEDELQKQISKKEGETEEDYTYRLYLHFQDSVTDYLIEHYPQLAQQE